MNDSRESKADLDPLRGSERWPDRWTGRDRFVVLQLGFGDGERFLSAWADWLDDPRRCDRLHYIAITPSLPAADRLTRKQSTATLAILAMQLAAALPPQTPNIHRLLFDQGRVELLLVIDELVSGMRGLVADVDAFDLDATAIGGLAREAQSRICKGMARLAASGAIVIGARAQGELGAGLRSAGFDLAPTSDATKCAPAEVARFAPRFMPSRPPARRHRPLAGEKRHALIIGAGLAGCATAAALAEQGWSSTVIDRHAGPAAEASGNTAGLFHGVVHRHDGHHARFNRAAALEAGRCFGKLIAGQAPAEARLGQVDGLLRLGSEPAEIPAMTALLERLRLPASHVQAVDAAQASALGGLPITNAAWYFPRGGWMRPALLARSWLEAAGPACRTIYGVDIASIRPTELGWAAIDSDGDEVAAAAHLVLANAGGATMLLDQLAGRSLVWPMQSVRGQTSEVDVSALGGACAPLLPLTGAGYLLPEIDGKLIFGATAQPGDDSAEVRQADHVLNKSRLAALSPALRVVDAISADRFDGRTGWRCVADDRLPLIGAVPRAWAGGSVDTAQDQPRFVERCRGLHLFVGLGSRGITWAPLGSRLLAGILSGAPLPLEADLVDAVDPARFACRASRRRAAAVLRGLQP